VLFTANDYVQATREHRRMMVEMEPLYAKSTAFVMAGMGEAPRLADYRSVSFWQKPSLLTAWNVTGQPVLRSEWDLAERPPPRHGRSSVSRRREHDPADWARVRAGHGVAHAHPQLVRDIAAPDVTPPPVLSGPSIASTRRRAICAESGEARGGSPSTTVMLAQLLEARRRTRWPWVHGLRRDHDLHHEPANVFSFPSSRLGWTPIAMTFGGYQPPHRFTTRRPDSSAIGSSEAGWPDHLRADRPACSTSTPLGDRRDGSRKASCRLLHVDDAVQRHRCPSLQLLDLPFLVRTAGPSGARSMASWGALSLAARRDHAVPRARPVGQRVSH